MFRTSVRPERRDWGECVDPLDDYWHSFDRGARDRVGKVVADGVRSRATSTGDAQQQGINHLGARA